MAIEKIIETTNAVGGAVIKLQLIPFIIGAFICFVLGILDVTKKIIFKKNIDGNVLNDVCVPMNSMGPSPGPSPGPSSGSNQFKCKNIQYIYKIDDTKYSQTSTINSYKKYNTNDPILISYNPNNPNQHRVGGADNRILGISLITCSIITCVGVYIVYKISSQKGVGTVATAGAISGMFRGDNK